jgi:geranylgeranyl diphosphate synthase type 3
LLGILQQKTTDDEVKRYAIKYMDGLGTFDFVRQFIEARHQMIMDKIAALGGNEDLSSIITHLMKKIAPPAAV